MKSYLIYLLVLLLPGLLAAQDKPVKTHKTNLSIVVMRYNEALNQLYWTNTKGEVDKSKSIMTSTSSILAPAKYEGPKKLMFHSLKKIADEGKGDFEPVASVSLPDSKNTIVIIFPNPTYGVNDTEGKTKELPYRAVAVSDNNTKFTLGSRFLLNLTAKPIRGMTGEIPFYVKAENNNRFILKPGESTIVTNLSGKTSNQVYIESYDEENDQWNRFKSSRWFHMPNRRKFVFIFQSGKNPPELKIVSQSSFKPKTDNIQQPENSEIEKEQ